MTAGPAASGPATPAPAVAPLVEMRGISIAFEGVPVLTDVDLRLFPGEVHSLMGENGAGKSTLVKALSGVYAVDAGTLAIGGEALRIRGVADAQKAGVAAVHQELGLCGNLTVGENVMLGNEVRGRWGIDWRRTHATARETLAELGLQDLDPRQPLDLLPPAAQRLVAVARAMVARPRVLVLDEPTSSLDQGEVARLFAVIRRLRGLGVAIVFVSHFLEQVYAISDRITILRDGRLVGEFVPDDLDRAELISKMFGTDIASLQAIGSQRREHRREPTGPPVYRAVGLGRRGMFAPTNVELYAGEIVGLAGLRGSGRTELALLLGAAEARDVGQTWVAGRQAPISGPRAALRHRIALLSDEGHDGGVVGELTVRENLLLALQALRGWTHPLSRQEEQSLVASYLEAFRITPADPGMRAKQPLRREQAQARAGDVPCDPPARADPRRAGGGCGRGLAGGDPAAGRAVGDRGDGGRLHLLRAGGRGPAQRPDHRAEGPQQDRRGQQRARDQRGHHHRDDRRRRPRRRLTRAGPQGPRGPMHNCDLRPGQTP